MQRCFIAVWSAIKVPTIRLEAYELQRTFKIHDQGLTANKPWRFTCTSCVCMEKVSRKREISASLCRAHKAEQLEAVQMSPALPP